MIAFASIAVSLVVAAVPAAVPSAATGTAAVAASDGIDAFVERLGRVGRAYAPTFSPDGRHVALMSDLSGMPQVWIVPATGGWPRAITVGTDPVGGVKWSPNSD